MMGTTLCADNLVLTPTRRVESAELAAHWRDPDVRRYLWDDIVIADPTVEAVIARSDADHARFDWGGWTVRDMDDAFVGWCGLRIGPPDGTNVVSEAGQTPGEAMVELIYSLTPRCWGRGFATAASKAVLRHVFMNRLLGEVWGGFDTPNVRSSKTLERLGFTYQCNRLLNTGSTPYWRIRADEWRARHSSVAD